MTERTLEQRVIDLEHTVAQLVEALLDPERPKTIQEQSEEFRARIREKRGRK